MFKNKILLITGGTGSFGKTILKKFLTSDAKEIRIFSRDEKKQEDLRIKYNKKQLKFIIGDVRDYKSVSEAVKDVDYIFHAAALKQVPSCEFYPLEAVNTNIHGTENVIDAAIHNNVKKIVILSTDKAVYPINAMGISKAMAEKVAIAKSRTVKNNPIICITRYGNVMGSRGSVIPLFIDQIKNNQSLTITDPNMTRFLMSLDESVDLVMNAFKYGKSGDIFAQKAPATSIRILAKAIQKILKAEDNIKIIGTRHGEKLYETLVSREELTRANEKKTYYRIFNDNRDLNYNKFFSKGTKLLKESDDYNSHNTRQLNLSDVIKVLNRSGVIK
tara:strand:+ start:116 stop:1108 length:993 start_codon:yes stop_codon:yes gene_type:complete